MKVSVIIPTYNNSRILTKCLEALTRQDHPLGEMEVVVIADGSRDDTMDRLAEFRESAPYELAFDWQENQGSGPARNNAIRRASHDLLLILNDDFIAQPDLVRKHAEWHQTHPAREYALLGFVEEFRGPGYDVVRLEKSFLKARDKGELSWEQFWTTNVSLKKALITETGTWFSNAFSFPAHEDVEFGYRLGKHGLRLFMDASARGLHDHPMDMKQYMKRAYQSGYCLVEFYKLHPELKDYLVRQGMTPEGAWRARVADALVNAWTIGPLERAIGASRRFGLTGVAGFFTDRLFGYHSRRGVRDGYRRISVRRNPTFGRIAEPVV
ncbi:MAG: glycosyltransferase [Elusimicrobia bacterium]|nr:glycosyltransferase [Elusimicrobiota bacterium]